MSMSLNNRHLAAITLECLRVGSALAGAFGSRPVREGRFIDATLAALGCPAMSGHDCMTRAERPSHPRTLLSLVMECYLGTAKPSPISIASGSSRAQRDCGAALASSEAGAGASVIPSP